MNTHPIAALFPLMQADEFAALKEAIKRKVEWMDAAKTRVRRAESWRESARSPYGRATDRSEKAGPLPAKDKEQVLAALAEARDTLTGWIITIEGWPVAQAG